jgi:Arc/MetJ family transcription regulator
VSRTTIDIDDELIARVMRIYGLRTKREAVEFALRELVDRRSPHRRALELEGSGWDGELDDLRRSRVRDW